MMGRRRNKKSNFTTVRNKSIEEGRKNLPHDLLFTYERLTPEELEKETEQEKKERIEHSKKIYSLGQTDKERTCSECGHIEFTPLTNCVLKCGYNICIECYVSNFCRHRGLIICYNCKNITGYMFPANKIPEAVNEIFKNYCNRFGLPLPSDNFCALSIKGTPLAI